MKKKGFTLVELLAVIVILAVISIITIPMIGNVIKDSKKRALETSVYGLVEAASYYAINHTGVSEFIFGENKKGETIQGEKLNYKGEVDVQGSLYIDNNGDISLCLKNEEYYVYKNYNSGIYVGEIKDNSCIIGYDVLTNKYVAMLDDGTGQVSNVYSKEEVNTLIDSVNTNVTSNTNEITSIKESITSLQTDISNYALKTDLDGLSSVVNSNQNSIDQLNNLFSEFRSHIGMIVQSTTLDTEEKVISIYGGNEWSKIEGRFLLGQSDEYSLNEEGGEATHTLTINEMPSHSHNYVGFGTYPGVPYGGDAPYISSWPTKTTTSTGGSQPHNNMPPYKVVYIWERVA